MKLFNRVYLHIFMLYKLNWGLIDTLVLIDFLTKMNFLVSIFNYKFERDEDLTKGINNKITDIGTMFA